MNRLLLPLGAALLLAATASASELFPFVLPWDDATPGVTDNRYLLEKPAGRQGFVTVFDGHLFTGDRRLRLFGVNVAFGGNFPTHADAEKVAARMAKFGINCVRFHHMDTGTAPAGLLQKDRRTLDPTALDKLDYFIAQLKQNGVYANLNLHVGNEYPGLEKWEGMAGYFKGVDNFYPEMIEQQRAFARALLTHVNPYTGAAYIDEPAVALIEINNENGLIMEWNNRTLDGMPDQYQAEFTRQWNDWLRRRYGTQEKLAAAWQAGEEPLGGELIANGDFAHNFDGWRLEQHSGAQAATAFSPGKEPGAQTLQVKVARPGEQAWHVQFSHGGLKVEGGKNYTVTLQARAEPAAKITLGLSQTHEPWKVLATVPVELTPEWKPITVALSPTESDEGARLIVSNLGKAAGTFEFSSFSLRSGGIIALREGESLSSTPWAPKPVSDATRQTRTGTNPHLAVDGERVVSHIPWFRKAEIGRRTLQAQKDWNEFLVETETAYWTGMRSYLRDELHARSLVVGSATGFSPWLAQARLDVVDAHAYWQHPHFPHRQWDQNDWTVPNLAMSAATDGGTLPGLALRRVAGKPFIVTEYNHASPNTYSSEAFLEICAVAALQDWDGIFAFAYSHRLDQWDTRRLTSFFDIDQHPAKMATLPAAVELFFQSGSFPRQSAHTAEVSWATALESVRRGGSWVDGRAYGLRREETFQHPIGFRLGEKDDFGPRSEREAMRTESGSFAWDTAVHRILLRAPYLRGFIGEVKAGERLVFGDYAVTVGATRQNWATFTIADRTEGKTSGPPRLLITATGDVGNVGMKWKDETHTSVGTQWGEGPSAVEGIGAEVVFPARGHLRAWALDGRGQRMTEIPVREEGGQAHLVLSPEQKTLWWEVAAQ